MDYPGRFADHIMPDKIHALSVSFVVDTLYEGFGGTAGNIAYNLALLEERPTILANAGNDFDSYRQWLESNAINTQSIAVHADRATATCHVMSDTSGSQITGFYPGATGEPYGGEVGAADLAIVAPSHPTDMTEFPKKFRTQGIPYFFDPGQQIVALTPEELQDILPGASVVFGNDYEIEMLLRKLGWSKDELLARVPVVVTTFGAQGSIVQTTTEKIPIAPVLVEKPVDPTGAGDAYRAGFAKGYLTGLSLQETGQLASTVGAYAVECRGTQAHRFTIEELRNRYVASYGTSIRI